MASARLSQNATAEDLAAVRHQLDLDRSAFARYLSRLVGVLHGDFGVVPANRRDIVREGIAYIFITNDLGILKLITVVPEMHTAWLDEPGT